MIALICTLEPGRIAWLPQFVRHYRDIGVERFFLTLQLEPGNEPLADDRAYALFRETLASLGIGDAFRLDDVYNGPVLMRHQRTIQVERLGSDDWIVWCDSDELQVYPAPLSEIIRQSGAQGVEFLRGVFIDRVAADYGLAAFDPRTSLWDAYPRACNVTLALAGGNPRKIALARGNVLVSGGKHALRGDVQLRTFGGWVQVHHFKWDATVLERLRYRIRPEWRAKFPWWIESQRLLDYFAANGSRFNPADLTPITLNGPHFIAFE